jgi:hypothetical protein
MLQGLSAFLKVHKRKVLFVSIAAAVGYASYRAYAALNAEIDAMKKRLSTHPGAEPQDLEARLEQVFVQAQMASDGAIAAFLGSLERRLAELVPRVSTAELKEQMAACKSSEEKMALVQAKATASLLHTGLCLYAVSLLAVALKTTYAVAAAAMVESGGDAAATAEAAEAVARRITEHALASDEGLAALAKRLHAALEECLSAVPIRQPCSWAAFGDLWRNVRCKLEDLSFDSDPALIFAPGEAVRRSLLRHAFPFSADGVSAAQPFAARVEAVLSGEGTLDVLNGVTQRLFGVYLERIRDKFDPATVLPLIRVVPLVQGESGVVLSSMGENPFLEAVVHDEGLRSYAETAAGMQSAPDDVRRILFVCARNDRESAVAAVVARTLASASGRVMLDVFSAAQTLTVAEDAWVGEEAVAEALKGSYHRPQGLSSVPRDVTFDAVVLFGNARPESAIAAKQTHVWPTLEDGELRSGLATRIKELLDAL